MHDIDFEIKGNSVLHRLDARIKMALVFMVILAVTVSGLFFAASVFLVCFSLMMWIRVPLKVLFDRLRYPLFIASVVAFIHPFTYGSDMVAHLFFISIYGEGISMAALIFARVLTAVLVLNLLVMVTPLREVLDSLKRLGVPAEVLLIAVLMLRYVSVFSEEGSRIYRAQWSRSGYSNSYVKKMEDYGTLCGMLIIRSLDRATNVYGAMLSRGYDSGSH
ncbi:MAG: cobalt ECF transporter T component CbiQ [Candidatus Hydrothermarchaeaceae archaeon]